MKNDHPSVNTLRESLTSLNFGKAKDAAKSLAQHVTKEDAQNLVNDLKSNGVDQSRKELLRNILMLAEVYFYIGNYRDANELLAPFSGSKNLAIYVAGTQRLEMRWRLQLAEYYYTNRKFAEAIKLLDELFPARGMQHDHFETGEIEFYRVRIALRGAQYQEILEHAMLALASLTDFDPDPPGLNKLSEDEKAKLKDEKDLLVRWRLGQLMLAFGAGAWRHGDPGRGAARLHLARWLLRTTPDQLNQAHAEQELGEMYRAQGKATEALDCLNKAQKQYEGLQHPLYLSRINTSLGTYWLSQKDYSRADERYAEAMRLAISSESQRQRAVIRTWQSWLSLERTPKTPKQLSDAITYAEEAIELLTDRESFHTSVDANLAMGGAYLEKEDLAKADKYFHEALKVATDHGLQKHVVHSHLSLATLFFKRDNTLQAQEHYHAAIQGHPFPDSEFLRGKRKEVEKSLKGSDAFYLTLEEVVNNSGQLSLNDYRDALESWLINQMSRREKGKIGKIAERLGVPRQRISKHFKDEEDELQGEKGRKNPKRGKIAERVDVSRQRISKRPMERANKLQGKNGRGKSTSHRKKTQER